MQTFKDLIVWQKAHQLVLDVYKFSEDFPRREDYCLTSQLRRAAISVPANIAEGFKKQGTADKARFFNISQGSLEEIRYYLVLAGDLKYGDPTNLDVQLDEVGRLLYGFRQAILRKGNA